MKTTLKFLGAAVLAAGFAAPALAQTDVATMTCGAFYAMDDAGRIEGRTAIMNFIKDTANAAVAGTAAELMANMTDEQAQAQIDKSCEGQAVDVNLLSVLK